MLSRWETALGGNLNIAKRSIRELRAWPNYEQARQEFSSSQQFRATALRYLWYAIEQDSHRQFDRWRWSGRAYGYAVCLFLELQKTAATLRRLEADRAGQEPNNVLKNFRVLHTNFLFRWERFQNEQLIPIRYHNKLRAQEIFQAGQSLDNERKEMINDRDALLQEVRNHTGDAVAQEILESNLNLVQQVRSLKTILRRTKQQEIEAQTTRQAEIHHKMLYEAFLCDANDNMTLLRTLTANLSNI